MRHLSTDADSESKLTTTVASRPKRKTNDCNIPTQREIRCANTFQREKSEGAQFFKKTLYKSFGICGAHRAWGEKGKTGHDSVDCRSIQLAAKTRGHGEAIRLGGEHSLGDDPKYSRCKPKEIGKLVWKFKIQDGGF